MPGRRKPSSAKQKKAELQFKRAQKRGDVDIAPPDPGTTKRKGRRGGRGPKQGGDAAVADASRRLESSFVKFSTAFLEEAKQKASVLVAERPIPIERALYPLTRTHECGRDLAVMKRPKWKYDMSKKEVENNEAGMFKKWLEESDAAVQRWAQAMNEEPPLDEKDKQDDLDSDTLEDSSDAFRGRMPTAPPMFERNLEVWRQL